MRSFFVQAQCAVQHRPRPGQRTIQSQRSRQDVAHSVCAHSRAQLCHHVNGVSGARALGPFAPARQTGQQRCFLVRKQPRSRPAPTRPRTNGRQVIHFRCSCFLCLQSAGDPRARKCAQGKPYSALVHKASQWRRCKAASPCHRSHALLVRRQPWGNAPACTKPCSTSFRTAFRATMDRQNSTGGKYCPVHCSRPGCWKREVPVKPQACPGQS